MVILIGTTEKRVLKNKMKEIECPECKHFIQPIPYDDSFSYAGTHCTNGRAGTYKGVDHEKPSCPICEYIFERDEYQWEN